jgi:hypothetical protein
MTPAAKIASNVGAMPDVSVIRSMTEQADRSRQAQAIALVMGTW